MVTGTSMFLAGWAVSINVLCLAFLKHHNTIITFFVARISSLWNLAWGELLCRKTTMECQVLSRWEEFGVRPEDLPSRVDFQSHDWIFNWQQLASRDLRGRLFLGQDPYKRFKWTQSDGHSCPKGLLYVAASWGIFWTDSKTLSTNHLHFKTRRIDQHRIRVKNIETLHVPDTETPFSL